MPAIERRQVAGALIYWGSVATIMVTLKQFYSIATADQLQWMLRPLVLLLELFSDLSFEPSADGVWLARNHRISIVKSCSGINFFIVSLLGYFWLNRNDSRRRLLICHALLAAWLTALIANTIRILLSVYLGEALAVGLSEADSHRLIGIAVYFTCLWAQLACFQVQSTKYAAVIAAAFYLGITLLVPWLRGWMLGLEPLNLRHAAWVVGIPLIAVLLEFGFDRKRL
ncbi:MAG: exosortase K [Gammaproteobacteria bacterium]